MSEWKTVRIGDFLKRVKIPIKLDPTKKYDLVTVRMHHQGVVLREEKLGKLIGSNMYRVSKGQFILSGIDSRNGAFGVVPDELDGAIVTNDFWYFDIDEKAVSRDFFLWLTSTPLFLDACIKSSEGTTNRRRLQPDKFYNFEFVFPEIHQQKELLKKLSGTDLLNRELSTELDQQLALLKQLRQSILQEAVEGKLTADWRKKNPVKKGDPEFDAVALLERITAEKERLIKEGKIRKGKPLAPVKDGEKPFELPKGWVWCRLCECGFINPRNYIDDSIDVAFSPMPLISSKYGVSPKFEVRKWRDVKSGFTHFAENDLAVAKITPCFENSKSGVFMNIKNGYGAGTTELHILRPVIVNSSFIYSFVKTSDFIQNGAKLMTGAVGQKRVPADYFANSTIALPPLSEQHAIVSRVTSLLSTLDTLESQISARKSQSAQLMQSVLREAFEMRAT